MLQAIDYLHNCARVGESLPLMKTLAQAGSMVRVEQQCLSGEMENNRQSNMTGLEIYDKELMDMIKDNQKYDSVLLPYHKSNADNLLCRKMYIGSSSESETHDTIDSDRPSKTFKL